jgi:pyridoxine 5-phosphate synthase
MHRIRLGVNVDHVATLRQARGTTYPDPVTAAALCELAGADQITVHLREDRRHIQERDLRILRQTVQTVLNLELAANDDVLSIATDVKPDLATLVPERRQEVTTEGGLAVVGREAEVSEAVARLQAAGIRVSLFINPDVESVEASARCGAQQIEIHTGFYSEARGTEQTAELKRIRLAASAGARLGLSVAAGHGLDYVNARAVCAFAQIQELNIGHAIMARAFFVGMKDAVREMIAVMAEEEVRRRVR